MEELFEEKSASADVKCSLLLPWVAFYLLRIECKSITLYIVAFDLVSYKSTTYKVISSHPQTDFSLSMYVYAEVITRGTKGVEPPC